MLNRGQCVSRVELLDTVWNLGPTQTTNIVDVYVNYLRRKLNDPPPGHLIRTVRGQGYMVPSETDLALPSSVITPSENGPVFKVPQPIGSVQSN
jgi:DNA-binding winged helix-turn-helix (wHTH) protein